MKSQVIALSGRIGAGKAALGERLADAIDADRVSFGAEVRRYAREAGIDSSEVGMLQRVGQHLVLHERSEFVRRVLAQRLRPDAHLIVEGLRHVEILLELRAQTAGLPFRLIHVDTPSALRETRIMARDNVERRLVARYEADINEEQSSRILPQYADATVNGDLPLVLQVARVVSFVGLSDRHGLASVG